MATEDKAWEIYDQWPTTDCRCGCPGHHHPATGFASDAAGDRKRYETNDHINLIRNTFVQGRGDRASRFSQARGRADRGSPRRPSTSPPEVEAQGPGFDLVHSSDTRDKLPRRFALRREMRMKKYHIELTDEEKALVEAIDLRISRSNHDEGHTRPIRKTSDPFWPSSNPWASAARYQRDV